MVWKKYKIEISPSAALKIERICEYIYYDLCMPEAASMQHKRLIEAIRSLSVFPERVKIITEIEGKTIRRLLVDNYIVLFYIENDMIRIINIVHSKSDINKLL